MITEKEFYQACRKIPASQKYVRLARKHKVTLVIKGGNGDVGALADPSTKTVQLFITPSTRDVWDLIPKFCHEVVHIVQPPTATLGELRKYGKGLYVSSQIYKEVEAYTVEEEVRKAVMQTIVGRKPKPDLHSHIGASLEYPSIVEMLNYCFMFENGTKTQRKYYYDQLWDWDSKLDKLSHLPDDHIIY